MILPSRIFHVLPNNDLQDHIDYCNFRSNQLPSCPCKCQPEHKEVENDGLIIIHNSFDGREGVEWVNEILKLND